MRKATSPLTMWKKDWFMAEDGGVGGCEQAKNSADDQVLIVYFFAF